MILIGKDLKQICNLIPSRVHKEHLQIKSEEIGGVQEGEQIAKKLKKSVN